MITNKEQIIIKPKKISMDTLGRMIKNGFAESDANLKREVGTINKRIDGLETKMDNRINDLEAKMNNKIDGLEVKMDKKIDGLGVKMNSLHAQFSTMSLNFVTFPEHNMLKDRVRKIEKRC